MHRRTSGTAMLVAAACLVATAAAPAAADPGWTVATTPATSTTSSIATTVTLITGDRVTVQSDGSALVAAADRRSGVSYLIQRREHHTSVVPSDALGLVHSGRLDPRLFDVTALVASGYDDKHHDLGLIVTSRGAAAVARSRASAAGATVTKEYQSLGAVAARRAQGKARSIWNGLTTGSAKSRSLRSDVSKIWLDAVHQPALDVSVPQIGAPSAWQAGYTGKGVTVAVLDTGVDGTHPDLVGKVVDHSNFTEGMEDDRDVVGHGTHVAATIASTGAGSAGKYRGVAPDAQLLAGKICVQYGCLESWILAGMQWAAAEKHAKIANMSLGGTDTPGIDPLEQAVETLTATYGTLFVIAAGNAGADGTVGSPGSADAALTVGAVDDTDALAPFSSRGPRVGDEAIKPDVTAPGVQITAARSKDATEVPGAPGDLYTTISGTSMATPHVAGAAALLVQEHPEATPAQLKALLMGTAEPNPALGPFAQGAGRIDVGRAVGTNLVADPPSVSFGNQRWPHTDDELLTKTLTYRNSGSTDVTLSLAVTATAAGAPAPAGMFTVTPTTVTVPAGGSASISVTADTRVDAANGYAGGRITATGGSTPITTPFAVDKEVESYDISLTHLDRTGAPTGNYDTQLASLDSGRVYEVWGDATTSLRVPAGRYLAMTFEYGDESDSTAVLLAQPGITVAAPTTLTMDGRVSKPSTITVAGAADTPTAAMAGASLVTDTVQFGNSVVTGSLATLYTGQIGTATLDGLVSELIAVWPAPTAAATASSDGAVSVPASYTTAWAVPGKLFTGLTRSVGRHELATIHGHNALATPETSMIKFLEPSWTFGSVGGALGGLLPLPSTSTEYVNTDGGVQWRPIMFEVVTATGMPLAEIVGPLATYRGGQSVHESFNHGVFAPSLAQPDDSFPAAVTRAGDIVTLRLR